jgi:predicted protein tyrosine phosphatase
MIEIYPRLFVGTQIDYEARVQQEAGWWVVHACKEPHHRQLLGYSGRGAPTTHPEYLIARRDKRLYLNLVDVDNPDYIAKEIVDATLAFIGEGLKSGERVLVHCNQGESRSPSIGLLYLAARAGTLPSTSLIEAEAKYRTIYPHYNPKAGMRGFLLRHWAEYIPKPPSS